MMRLVRITNPNPRTLSVWRGSLLIASLKPHDQVLTPLDDQLSLSCEGKARVVLQLEGGGDLTDEEAEARFVMLGNDQSQWVQEVGPTPCGVHPDLALKAEALNA